MRCIVYTKHNVKTLSKSLYKYLYLIIPYVRFLCITFSIFKTILLCIRPELAVIP